MRRRGRKRDRATWQRGSAGKGAATRWLVTVRDYTRCRSPRNSRDYTTTSATDTRDAHSEM